jgi:hypothetical protein
MEMNMTRQFLTIVGAVLLAGVLGACTVKTPDHSEGIYMNPSQLSDYLNPYKDQDDNGPS